jgi:ABC-type antimicrobial peptide transport system permease subunit
MVLREALWMVVAGVLVGVPAALAAARLARGILYGIRPGDPAAVLIGVATLLVVGVCAGIVPARRAAAIDPIQTLRTE